jgi:NAD(P) transhydrogenase subunit alpha
VREQVQSLGGVFVPFEFNESGEGTGGYAKEMSDAYLQAEQAMIAKECAGADIVITTALVPGKPAPELITSGAVVGMRDGSVIVDLAAEQGGNCALTDPDRVVERFGKKIVGVTNLTSLMAVQASELYAQTVFNLFEEIYKPDRDAIVPNFDDEVHRGATVARAGEITWPPPIKPVIRDGGPTPSKSKVPPAPAHVAPPRSPWVGRIGGVAAIAVLGLLGLFAPDEFLQHFTVFLLACVVGWHVVWNVSPALHTPLMSVTNAISGIIVIGGMVVMAGRGLGTTSVLAGVAVLVASINVAGGFLVTQRMLKMFRK